MAMNSSGLEAQCWFADCKIMISAPLAKIFDDVLVGGGVVTALVGAVGVFVGLDFGRQFLAFEPVLIQQVA